VFNHGPRRNSSDGRAAISPASPSPTLLWVIGMSASTDCDGTIPIWEADSGGELKVKQKCLSPSGRSNMLCLPPSCDSALLGNAELRLIITEGEFEDPGTLGG